MPTSKLSVPEALIHAMLTVSAVDRNITKDELARIGTIVRELPAFHEFSEDWLVTVSQDCGKVLAKKDGLETVLAAIKASLPEHMYETAYVLAAELAATDLKVAAEEVRFLEMLADRLKLDKLTCAALERAARARHQKA